MTDALKTLIEEAPIKRSGKFRRFLIIPTGEQYDGFWGKNGYNNIILLGQELDQDENDKYYNITDSADVVTLAMIKSIHFDVPTEYNCIRFWTDGYIEIHNEMNVSTIMGYPEGAIEREND